MLKENENIEPFGGGIKIIVSDEHKFWTDTILLARKMIKKSVISAAGADLSP